MADSDFSFYIHEPGSISFFYLWEKNQTQNVKQPADKPNNLLQVAAALRLERTDRLCVFLHLK